jgi:hypothetical protein
MRVRVVATTFLLILGGALAPFGCGESLPRPPSGPQPPDVFAEVPYPPPPGRVEMVPDRPNKTAVWIDGQWTWLGRRWFWEPGGWVEADPRTYFARWALERRSDGRLYFAPSRWRWKEGGGDAPEPEMIETTMQRPRRREQRDGGAPTQEPPKGDAGP